MNRKIRKRRKKGIESLQINTSISIGCAIVNLIVIIILTVRATVTNGNTSILMGLIGFVSIIIGAFGIYYAIKGMKEDDTNYMTMPLVAIISNGILTLFLIVLYIIGIFV